MQPQASSSGFTSAKLLVNGVEITLLTAGSGEPVLCLHGAGTFSGFDALLPLAEHCRLMIPYHPGFGESADGPYMDTITDYTMHYLEFIDQLGIDKVNLIGFSMGGRMAATFAYEHRRRVNRLVLVAPAGIDVPGYPMVDFASIPPEEVFGYLASDIGVVMPHIPANPSREWQDIRRRESASFAALIKGGLSHPKFQRWLHRVTMPTLVVWGEADRVLPIPQADAWMKLLPNARLIRYPGAGHLLLEESPQAVADILAFLGTR